ncbi:MAG: hypothetical protein WC899_10980 [bacterium]|jgi:hypothetical protein
MIGKNPRSIVRLVVAILCASCFLTITLGTVSRTFAAEEWPVWPKKTTEPGIVGKTPPPAQPSGAAQAGDSGGTDTKKGMSAGTKGAIAAGIVGVIAIGIAAGSGGSSSGH